MRKQRKNKSGEQSHEGQHGTVLVTISMGPREALFMALQEMEEQTSVGLTLLSIIIAVFSMYHFQHGVMGEWLDFATRIGLLPYMCVSVLIASFTH